MNRIDDDQIWLFFHHSLPDVGHVNFGQEKGGVRLNMHPIRPHFDLLFGFFAGDVQHLVILTRDVFGHLKQQCRLPDAGVAAQQRNPAADNAAAEHAVEFFVFR